MRSLKDLLILLPFFFLSLPLFTEEDHDMHDLMAHFITPAAEKIWESTGFVITEEGEVSLEPKDNEGWNEVVFGAQVIIESSYSLKRLDRSLGREDWIAFSSLLEPIGRQAVIAAEAKDSEALFQIGADLYQACVACHNVYMKK